MEAVVGSLVSSLFGGGKDTPPPPKVAPTPDDRGIKRSRERRMQRDYAGQGRLGTSLQGDDSKLG